MITAALAIAFALHTASPAPATPTTTTTTTSTAAPAWQGFDDLAGFDKLEHVGANVFIVDFTWGIAAFYDAPLWARVAFGVGAAATASIGKELWDAAGNGDPSLGDLTYDALGIGTGVGFALAAEAAWIRASTRE